ncbi:MAG: hypothetical protein JW969_09175 [Spirochaetales bacterium]|nr:hypothetical protein [Spirochaetales bacterium]
MKRLCVFVILAFLLIIPGLFAEETGAYDPAEDDVLGVAEADLLQKLGNPDDTYSDEKGFFEAIHFYYGDDDGLAFYYIRQGKVYAVAGLTGFEGEGEAAVIKKTGAAIEKAGFKKDKRINNPSDKTDVLYYNAKAKEFIYLFSAVAEEEDLVYLVLLYSSDLKQVEGMADILKSVMSGTYSDMMDEEDEEWEEEEWGGA